jgi:hypothetical protein
MYSKKKKKIDLGMGKFRSTAIDPKDMPKLKDVSQKSSGPIKLKDAAADKPMKLDADRASMGDDELQKTKSTTEKVKKYRKLIEKILGK